MSNQKTAVTFIIERTQQHIESTQMSMRAFAAFGHTDSILYERLKEMLSVLESDLSYQQMIRNKYEIPQLQAARSANTEKMKHGSRKQMIGRMGKISRLALIHKCITEYNELGLGVYCREILSEVRKGGGSQVCKSTIEKDLFFLRTQFNAPIVSNKSGYFYTEDFCFNTAVARYLQTKPND